MLLDDTFHNTVMIVCTSWWQLLVV